MSKIKTEKMEEKENNESPVTKEVEINIEAFASQVGLPWQTKSRLEYYIDANKLPKENTIDGWKAIVKKV